MNLYYIKMSAPNIETEIYEMFINAESVGDVIEIVKKACNCPVDSIFICPMETSVLFTEDYGEMLAEGRKELERLEKSLPEKLDF